VYSDEKVRLQVGRLKAAHRLSVADALIAAVAGMQDATQVHKDPGPGALRSQAGLLSLHHGQLTRFEDPPRPPLSLPRSAALRVISPPPAGVACITHRCSVATGPQALEA